MAVGQNSGFSFEKNIKLFLDNNRYKDIDPFCQKILFKIDNGITPDSMFSVGEPPLIQSGLLKKTDVFILKNNQYFTNLSIKKGESNSIHQENIFKFCDFLVSIGATVNEINAIKKYHWGDGSLDGSIGLNDVTKRKCNSELRTTFFEEINVINETFKKYSDEILVRVFLGVHGVNAPDYLIYSHHGTLNDLSLKSMDEVLNFHKRNLKSRAGFISIGNLTYQNWNRCCKGQDLKLGATKHRNDIQFKWNLVDDINDI